MTAITARVADYLTEMGEAELRRFLERNRPASADEFLARLYADLRDSIDALERMAQDVQTSSENSLRGRIVRDLRCRGYDARAESDERGHADMLVENRHISLVWIGETKKHDAYDWLEKGLRQLHDRYTTGRHPDSGLIVFVFTRDAASVMRTWRHRLESDALCGFVQGSCRDLGHLCFSSRHTHGGSGTEVSTRHMFVALHYKPTDPE